MNRKTGITLVLILIVLGLMSVMLLAPGTKKVFVKWLGLNSPEEVLVKYPETASRLSQDFPKVVAFPPSRVYLLVFKSGKTVELWAEEQDKMWKIKSYELTTFSGKNGPKLAKDDGQIPEGVYGISGFKPNSKHGLALKLSFPNGFDKDMAQADGRTGLANEVLVHEGGHSEGDISLKSEAIQELYYLGLNTGLSNMTVMIFPNDARKDGKFLSCDGCPGWVGQTLYPELKKQLERFQ